MSSSTPTLCVYREPWSAHVVGVQVYMCTCSASRRGTGYQSRTATGGFPGIPANSASVCVRLAHDSRDSQQLQHDGGEPAAKDHRHHDDHQSGGEDELPLVALRVPGLYREGREEKGGKGGEKEKRRKLYTQLIHVCIYIKSHKGRWLPEIDI